MMAYALKEIKKDGVVLERLNDKINVEVAADAVVLFPWFPSGQPSC